MKTTKIFGGLVLILLLNSTFALAQYDSIPFGVFNRTYLVHLPTGYNGNTELPLVIAMHGGFGNAYNLQNQSQLSVKADEENFIVVYPEGVRGGALNISSWNAGWCCGYASRFNVDDVGFINALLDTLMHDYAIDINRVYATGMSNGGFMSYRLACELSDRIAAIAPVAASMSVTSCNPERPVPIISLHSYIDTNVPHNGGVGSGVSNHHNSPQDSVLNSWAEKNNCEVIENVLVDNLDYTRIQWTNCDCDTEIELYLTSDGGHSWPGGNATAVGDPVSNFINANDLMWEFFEQHSLDCVSSSISIEPSESDDIELYPNPTNGLLKIRSNDHWATMKTSIHTSNGEKIMSVEGETTLDLSALPNGIYFVMVDLDNKKYLRKIAKIN